MFRGEQLAQSAMRAAGTEALRSGATVHYNGGPSYQKRRNPKHF